jgi:hypothetical protein
MAMNDTELDGEKNGIGYKYGEDSDMPTRIVKIVVMEI